MSTLTATRGLPASGKTSYAMRRLAEATPGSLVRLNRDDIRWMAHGAVHHRNRTEVQVNAIQQAPVAGLLRSGADVIADDTNLRAGTLRRLAELATAADARFEVVDFTDVDVEECIARDRDRPDQQRRVGEAVIRDMHQRFLAGRELPLPVPSVEPPAAPRPYEPPPGALPAVLCDIDGTLAADAAVGAALGAARAAGDRVLLASGRPETHRGELEHSLAATGLGYDALHLRRAGDTRRNAVVKVELFDEHIREQFRVRYVLAGPGAQVWRSLTLTVFQLAAART